MTSIAFNPMPNISLGDMEDIFDIENELAIMSNTDKRHSATSLDINKDKIVKQFMLDEIVSIIDTEETDEGLLEYTTNDEDTEEDDIDDSELEGYADDDEDDNEEDQFDIDESELITDDEEAEQEVVQAPTKQIKVETNKREEELLARIKQAEENKRIEEEEENRLRELAEKAIQAEQAAVKAKQLREQESIRIEQEKKIQAEKQLQEANRIKKEQEEKRQAEHKLKLEQEELKAKQEENEKREKIKQLLASKKRQETAQSKQSVVNSIKSDIKSTPIQAASDYDMYNSLDVDALYGEVRKFLKLHNVEKKITDIKVLEDQFGKVNIKKLILKSYLISIGKGVTVGK